MADTNGAVKPARASGSPQATKSSTGSLSSKKSKKASRSFLGYIFNTVARIFTWYSIFILLFRCPSSLEECDASSPRLCKPYFQVKQIVAPHVQKQYDAYAAPYVQVVKPYYDTVDRAVISPAWDLAVKYGAPQVQQAQAFGQAQWNSNIQPQLAKAQDAAAQQYNQVLGPHVDKVATAVAPYYEIGRNSALQTHHEVILPAYEFLSPYALQGYSAASAFTTGTIVPVAVWTYGQASEFVDSTVLPQLRIFYVNTVEPQLQKIGLSLGQYSDKASQRTTTASSSFTKPAQPTTSTTSIKAASSSTTTSTTTTAEPETTSVATVDAPSSVASAADAGAPGITDAPKLKRPEPIVQDEADSSEDDARRTARETVAEDLHAWQAKYTKAADEGAAEIEKSVEEISKKMIRRVARTVGKGMVEDLQKAVVSNLVTLRREIRTIVGSVKQETATSAEAEEQVLVVVRRAGVEIKEKAQAVRSWREEYGKELQDTISRAAENHFQILGSIRDLALQRIGMKWAWMEGITYKDWAKYHQLKGRFEEWENDLEQLIVTHPGLEAATSAGQAVEDEAMGLAASAAKELARLRQVAELKIAELDDSDEFDADTIKANVAAAKEAAAQAAREAEEAAAAEAAAQAAKEAEEAAAAEAAAQEALEAEKAAREEALAAAAAANEAVGAGPIFEAGEDAESEESAKADTEAADAATIAPDEVPIILGEAEGEATASVDDTVSETVETADFASTETVHLPVDEVVAADEVPLAVASSVDAEATVIEEAASKHVEEAEPVEVKTEEAEKAEEKTDSP